MSYSNGAYLVHHGIKGMKWGVRRFQNEDGTLTEEGKKRYYTDHMIGKDIAVKRGTSYGNYDRPYTSYTVTRNGNSAIYQEKAYHKMWRDAEDTVLSSLAETENMTVDDVKRSIDHHKDYQPIIDALVEEVVHEKLSKVLDLVDRIDAEERSKQKSKPKYTSKDATNKVYANLEKRYPNWNKLSQEKQDKLFMEEANRSGMYRYM